MSVDGGAKLIQVTILRIMNGWILTLQSQTSGASFYYLDLKGCLEHVNRVRIQEMHKEVPTGAA